MGRVRIGVTAALALSLSGCSLVVSDDPSVGSDVCGSAIRRISLDRPPTPEERSSGGGILVYEDIDFMAQWSYTSPDLLENPSAGFRPGIPGAPGAFAFENPECLVALRFWTCDADDAAPAHTCLDIPHTITLSGEDADGIETNSPIELGLSADLSTEFEIPWTFPTKTVRISYEPSDVTLVLERISIRAAPL